jgi:ElaB/YqjD/DUF883 family membrane-anchored ribosome-binding protein
MNDTHAAKQKLAEDFRLVMDDIDALMRASANKADGEVTALRTRIRDRLETARHRAADLQDRALDQAKEAARATDDYVHEHPWASVGIAAAAGMVLGLLIGRR